MYVLSFDQLDRAMGALAGGKGANLGELTRAGFPVPPGFVVTTEAHRSFVMANDLAVVLGGLSEQIGDPADISRLDEVSHHLRQHLLAARFPFELRSTILDHYRQLSRDKNEAAGKVPPVLVAVRSSPTPRDANGPSLRGEKDSLLNVIPVCEAFDGESCQRCWNPVMQSCDVIGAIQQCWSSLFSSRAISHRHRRGGSGDLPLMAVVVQRMVNGEKSGVVFTADPADGNRQRMVVEAAWGLGEGVASRRVAADYIVYDKQEAEVLRKVIAKKESLVALDLHTGRTREVETPPDQVRAEVLSDEELHGVARLGRAVERLFGSPRQIDFTISGGEVHLLQSRPVLTL